MLFKERAAVYYESHTESGITMWIKSTVFGVLYEVTHERLMWKTFPSICFPACLLLSTSY